MSIAERLPVSDRINIMVNQAGLHLIRQMDGVRAKSLCPFHSEKVPSWYVNEKNGLWNCFGCGKGGDFLTFVSLCRGIDRKTQFPQLLKYIDERHGTSLYEVRGTKSAEETTDRYLCTDYARNYYHETLLQILRDRAPHPVKDHLARRNLALETLKRFHVGYGGDSWTHLLQHLTGITLGNKKLTAEYLEVLGLAFKPEGSSHPIDCFAKRIVFPIVQGGRTLSFAGREIEDHGPKYRNGKESPDFQKSFCVFGLDEAAPAIRETGTVILVEGYFDVLALHQLGFANVVGLMGTNLSAGLGSNLNTGQLDQLRNLADRFVLFLDCDPPGRRATAEKILPVLMTEDIECRVVDLSDVFGLTEKVDAGRLLEDYKAKAAEMISSNQVSTEAFLLSYCLNEGPQEISACRNFTLYTFARVFRNLPNPDRQHAICRKLSGAIGIEAGLIIRYFTDECMFQKLADEFRRKEFNQRTRQTHAAACSTT